jgi:6-bladed beta-propeller
MKLNTRFTYSNSGQGFVRYSRLLIESAMIAALVAFIGSECQSLLFIMTTAQDDDQLNLCDFHRIKKFDSNGKLITSWGEKGNGDGQFIHRYVTDQRNNRIQKFDSNGNFLAQWGKEGNGPGEFVHLHAISIDNNDTIYVSDARDNGRISTFDTNGNFISMWGSVGERDGEFKEHHGDRI